MTTTTLPAVEVPGDIPLFPVRKFCVRENHRMIEAGILGEDDNGELIEGWIVPRMRVYARARIAQYWIVNRNEMLVEVYTGPVTKAGTPQYRQRVDYFEGDEIEVAIGDEVVLFPVSDLLP